MSGGERRLAAIMFTDIVGFTRSTQANESLTLELLEEHRALLRPLFPAHSGTEVKTMGDAFLVEFKSALEAVLCAVDIQKKLRERNSGVLSQRKVELRIGIHVGDVVHAPGHSWPFLIKTLPIFEEVRKDPRFPEFCRKVGLAP